MVIPAHGRVGGGDGPTGTADHESHPDVGVGGGVCQFFEMHLKVEQGFVELWLGY